MRDYVKFTAAGFLGMALFYSAWHFYIDHQVFHALLNAAQQQAQRQEPPKGP